MQIVIGAQEGADDSVDCMEQDLPPLPSAHLPLVKSQKVVHEDVNILEWLAWSRQGSLSKVMGVNGWHLASHQILESCLLVHTLKILVLVLVALALPFPQNVSLDIEIDEVSC